MSVLKLYISEVDKCGFDGVIVLKWNWKCADALKYRKLKKIKKI